MSTRKQRYSIYILMALAPQLRYLTIFSYPKLPLLVTEAFSTMGKGRQIRVFRSSNADVSAPESFDSEPSVEKCPVVFSQPPYKIAGVDLSASWVDLVRQSKVSSSTTLPSSRNIAEDNTEKDNSSIEDSECKVEYGIRLVEKKFEKSDEIGYAFEEYVRQIGDERDNLAADPLISKINATLTQTQHQSTGSGVVSKRVGNFVSQLQLVRTLRPPPSEGFNEATTCVPPPYSPTTDSFVTGPLRLNLRPFVGSLNICIDGNESDYANENDNILTTSWDVFHNISPADRRGHFLLLPSLKNEESNFRGQYLTKDDCHDLVHLTSTIEPAGAMFIGYNSVGAGASQNHIHCHAWPHPINDSKIGAIKDDISGYAVNNVDSIFDFYDIEDGKVEVSYLNYPVFCVQLSSSVANLDLLGKALATCIEVVGEAPHNVGFLNRIEENEKDDELVIESSGENIVDVFVFARSRERSSILPTLKLGISEMMGVFHAQSEAELEVLTAIQTILNNEDGSFQRISAMEQALADVSVEDEIKLWDRLVAKLAIIADDD